MNNSASLTPVQGPKQNKNNKNELYMVITLLMSLTKYQTITFIMNVSD